jgi:hypothetical protein
MLVGVTTSKAATKRSIRSDQGKRRAPPQPCAHTVFSSCHKSRLRACGGWSITVFRGQKLERARKLPLLGDDTMHAGIVNGLRVAKQLLDDGILSTAEFEKEKSVLLQQRYGMLMNHVHATQPPPPPVLPPRYSEALSVTVSLELRLVENSVPRPRGTEALNDETSLGTGQRSACYGADSPCPHHR